GVRLGEAVIAEALDLLEQRFAELARNPFPRESLEQPLAVARELAVAPPSRHVAPELIGFAAGVSSARDRDLHHLLLKERHAQRPLEDRREIRMRRFDRLFAVTTPEVRMDHA